MHVREEVNNEELLKEEVASDSPFIAQEDLKDMVNVGVLFGRKKSKTQPKMNKYIFTYSKGIAIFDAPQTLDLLNKAVDFLKSVLEKKLPILIVGTQPVAKDLVRAFADKYKFAYVTERWLGGTLTNFPVISKRIEYFKKTKIDKSIGKLAKYTKKEQLIVDRMLEKMAINFTGLEILNQLPAALIVIDSKTHDTAVREAKKMNIPIVAIINNDNNPDGIKYPIPANDNMRSSLIWILNKIELRING